MIYFISGIAFCMIIFGIAYSLSAVRSVRAKTGPSLKEFDERFRK